MVWYEVIVWIGHAMWLINNVCSYFTQGFSVVISLVFFTSFRILFCLSFTTEALFCFDYCIMPTKSYEVTVWLHVGVVSVDSSL